MSVSWKERAADEVAINELIGAGFSALQSRLLAIRGISAKNVDEFFNPSMTNLATPTDLPGVREVVARLILAIREKKQVIVFGDYDCDGVCATAILVSTLRALKCNVEPFLPERMTEGYGMTEASVARMLAMYPSLNLVITVDNGINSTECVASLKSRGVEVIVTDHHLPGESLPDCLLVNPKVAAPEELDSLCGAGVAFLIAAALIASAKKEGLYDGPNIGGPLLVLAGLATVTDIMPLLGQNRLLVSEALAHFRSWAPLGLRELLDRASRTTIASLTSRDFGFLLGPRINAAGRVASGMEAVRLILATDREEARLLALSVDLSNTKRKSIEQKMTEMALAQVEKNASAQVISLKSEDGAHYGIAGVVAARIMERISSADRPVPVAVVVDGHGSARSPEGYHVRNALQASSEALSRFGGHAAAGGLTILEGKTNRFRELFRSACAAQAAAMEPGVRGVTFADAEVNGKDLTLDFANWIQRLEPFGECNQPPVFLLRKVYFTDVKVLGSDGRHLQVMFKGPVSRAVWWNRGDLVEQLRKEAALPHDILATVEVSSYGGDHVELRLQAITVSEG